MPWSVSDRENIFPVRQTPASVGRPAGFAFVELLVVMPIIGTLAGLILPAISQA